MRTKYTKEQLEPIVKASNHWADVCRAVGVKPFTGGQVHIKNVVVSFGLDYSHFRGMGWNKGKTFVPKKSIEEYLSNKFFITSHKLKERLIKEDLKKPLCEKCGMSEWNGQVLPLELDHIDGSPDNNQLENLQILCPNCHAIKTRIDAYNRRRNKPIKSRKEKESKLCGCGQIICKRSLLCSKCSARQHEKIKWPDTSWLINEVNKANYTAIGKKLGVSANAIRKRLENHPEA